jgi:hypothetical protein
MAKPPGRVTVAGSPLAEKFPDRSEWKKDLAWFDQKIAALEK